MTHTPTYTNIHTDIFTGFKILSWHKKYNRMLTAHWLPLYRIWKKNRRVTALQRDQLLPLIKVAIIAVYAFFRPLLKSGSWLRGVSFLIIYFSPLWSSSRYPDFVIKSIVVPVANKVALSKTLNHEHPMALTSLVMKSFKRIVQKQTGETRSLPVCL